MDVLQRLAQTLLILSIYLEHNHADGLVFGSSVKDDDDILNIIPVQLLKRLERDFPFNTDGGNRATGTPGTSVSIPETPPEWSSTITYTASSEATTIPAADSTTQITDKIAPKTDSTSTFKTGTTPKTGSTTPTTTSSTASSINTTLFLLLMLCAFYFI